MKFLILLSAIFTTQVMADGPLTLEELRAMYESTKTPYSPETFAVGSAKDPSPFKACFESSDWNAINFPGRIPVHFKAGESHPPGSSYAYGEATDWMAPNLAGILFGGGGTFTGTLLDLRNAGNLNIRSTCPDSSTAKEILASTTSGLASDGTSYETEYLCGDFSKDLTMNYRELNGQLVYRMERFIPGQQELFYGYCWK